MRKPSYAIQAAAVLLALALLALAAPRAAAQAPVVVTPGEVHLMGEGGSGWLGVTIAEVTAEKAKELKLPAERGVIVADVEADGPAAKAGLKANDVITEYNGERIEGAAQFRRLIRETPAGRTVQLTIWRGGQSQSISAQLGNHRDHMERHFHALMAPRDFDFHFEMPDIPGNFLAMSAPRLGVSAEDLSGQLGNYFGAPDGEGILVREVLPGTSAEKAGLKAGDVITKLDGERVRNVGELRGKMREKRDKKTVNVTVLRKGAETSLNVEVERPPERKKGISRRTTI